MRLFITWILLLYYSATNRRESTPSPSGEDSEHGAAR